MNHEKEDARRRFIFGRIDGDGQGREADNSNSNGSTDHQYTPDQLERGRLVLRRFGELCRECPEVMRRAKTYSLDRAARGEVVSARAIVEDIRRLDLVDAHGRGVSLDNRFTPIIARRLWLEHPDVRGHVELRRCVYDVLMGVPHGRG